MRARRSELQIFSISFLDVLSCGLGAVLIILLVSFRQARDAEQARDENQRLTTALEGARTQVDALARLRDSLNEKIRGLAGRLQGAERGNRALQDSIRGLERQVDSLAVIVFKGIRTNKKRVVILVDVSGSMEKVGPRLVDAVELLIDLLPDERFWFNVLGFQGESGPAAQLTPWEPRGRLVPASAANLQAAKRFVRERLRIDGGTPTPEAVEAALMYGRVEAILLLTDGVPNGCGGRACQTCKLSAFPDRLAEVQARIVRANGRRVEIHTIGIGTDLYESVEFRNFLEQLARDNGGEFVAL